MTTEQDGIWPPNEIQYDHRAYRMAARETVEITTKTWSPRPHSEGYHFRRTSHGDREDYRELYRTKPLTKMLTEWRTEGSTNYRRTAYQTEYQTTIPEAYQMTTEKPTNILSELPTEMATEKSTKNAPTLSTEWLSPWNGPPRPCRMPSQEMPRSANAMYKAAFREQKRAPIMVSMTTYCHAYVLDTDQWYTAHTQCNWHQFCHPQEVTASAILEPQSRCQERKLTSLFEVKLGSTWWSTMSPILLWPILMMVYA